MKNNFINYKENCKNIDLEMIAVQGGTFLMGKNACYENGEPILLNKISAYYNEYPVHEVSVSDFYIGKYPITQKQWKAIMGTPLGSNKNSDNYPITNVNWHDIQIFIEKLNKETKQNYRLLNEAEWEYAARGGVKTNERSSQYKFSGSKNIDDVAWYRGNSNKANDSLEYETHNVGLKQANELGLYDMSGNVWEWCNNNYQHNYHSIKDKHKYRSIKVLRGGSCADFQINCSVSARSGDSIYAKENKYGFRLANEKFPKKTEKQTNKFCIKTTNDFDIEMIEVTGGSFIMDGGDTYFSEDPHMESVSDFLIGKYPVTQKQWNIVMKTKSKSDKRFDNYPVNNVSWDDIQLFLERLNEKTNKTYRLPTSIEWEYAADGGVKTNGRSSQQHDDVKANRRSSQYKYSGSNNIEDVAWYDKNSYDKGESHSDYGIHKVGTKQANELGIFDMTGNVWEWCNDWCREAFIGRKSTVCEWIHMSCPCVLRGGSWRDESSKITYASCNEKDIRKDDYGFRLVLIV